ncbi:VWA domain-containing protein [bacterium]|nr:VWA domain-containing protein [bacterium]
MMKQISDKSLHFSHVALKDLEEILNEKPNLPQISKMSQKDIRSLKDQMRGFFEDVKKIGYKNFSFLADCKDVRDFLAHTTGDISNEEIFENFKTFFSFADKAKSELEANIRRAYSQNKEIRKFEKFGSSNFGNEIERKALTQSLADAFDNSIEDSEKLPFSKNQAAQEAEKFLRTENQEQKELLDFAASHSRLSQQIQEEILKTLQTAYDETEITNPKNPFYDENLFLHKMNQLSDEELLSTLAEQKKELNKTKTGKNSSADFGFYAKQYEKLIEPEEKEPEKKKSKESKPKKIDPHELEILSRNLKKDLNTSLHERYLAWQLEEIDKKRKKYLKELYEKIAQFKKLEELLSPFIRNFGRLWDLSKTDFNDYGFDILKMKEFAELLKNDKSLQELADLIGRQNGETERYEKELREKIDIKTEFHPKPAYRGQISGIRLSGEISSALPSALAMSANPKTKPYFNLQVTEKKLPSYSYTNRQKFYREERGTEEVEVPVKEKEQKGPVIICVDTSGSMNGTPERVAKTITFALAKKCLEEERKCYLISFSTGIEVQDLSEFEKGSGLLELAKFLRKSFNGGTDAEPALQHSLALLQKNDWKNADVLVVSDMVMGNLSESVKTSIKSQQVKETKFYSLLVGNSGNKNVIEVFDENWSYDINSRDAMRHLVRQTHKLNEINKN